MRSIDANPALCKDIHLQHVASTVHSAVQLSHQLVAMRLCTYAPVVNERARVEDL